jgi:hypothetical protein
MYGRIMRNCTASLRYGQSLVIVGATLLLMRAPLKSQTLARE